MKKSERGFLLLECILYILLLAVVIDLSFMAYYRYDQHTRNLRRNADDIVRAMRVGERWRGDVRSAIAPPQPIENGLMISQKSGEVAYVFVDGTVWRQTGVTRVAVLKQVKASTMAADSRQRVNAWRWELELASPNGLMSKGWKVDSLRTGSHIDMSGYPARDGSHLANARKVTVTQR